MFHDTVSYDDGELACQTTQAGVKDAFRGGLIGGSSPSTASTRRTPVRLYLDRSWGSRSAAGTMSTPPKPCSSGSGPGAGPRSRMAVPVLRGRRASSCAGVNCQPAACAPGQSGILDAQDSAAPIITQRPRHRVSAAHRESGSRGGYYDRRPSQSDLHKPC